jgi:hypothetical protein
VGGPKSSVLNGSFQARIGSVENLTLGPRHPRTAGANVRACVSEVDDNTEIVPLFYGGRICTCREADAIRDRSLRYRQPEPAFFT